ncbi:MAG: GTPase domain-containing protein [Deltaproteobacteria bacterium]|nr:GTPase domain-containing protein [Deltaproteobacteria bacterium]
MAYFSPATKEITAKIVYYGPGMCGKTTNLQKVHQLMKQEMRGDLVSVATETDRTIYFDFLPMKLGKIAGFDFVTRCFTVPGQPYYAETRRMVLQGADGVVFVADSQRFMMDQNRDSMLDLKKNLKANNLDFATIPMVIQYNKQDMKDLSAIEDLEAALNERRVPHFRSSAYTGQGVVETLKHITLAVFKHVRDGGLAGRAAATHPRAQAPAAQNAAASRPAISLPELSQARAAPVPAPVPAPMASAGALEAQAARIAQNATQAEAAPMPSKEAIASQEFQNLAVLHHKLVERVATLETDNTKLKRDIQDIKAIIGKKLMK